MRICNTHPGDVRPQLPQPGRHIDDTGQPVPSTSIMGMKKKQMQTCGEVTEQAPSDTSTLDNSAADTSTQGAHLSDTPAQDDALPDISALTITQPATNPKTKERFDVVKAWKAYFREGELSDWARFCIDLGLEGDFSSKRKCKKVHVCPAHT